MKYRLFFFIDKQVASIFSILVSYFCRYNFYEAEKIINAVKNFLKVSLQFKNSWQKNFERIFFLQIFFI